MASLMKNDVKLKVPNETPKTLIPSDGGDKLGWGVEIWWQAKR
jgi:hypothetical protein